MMMSLRKSFERDRRIAIGVVDQVGPCLELRIVRHTALQRDRFKLPNAAATHARAGIATFTMRDRLGAFS